MTMIGHPCRTIGSSAHELHKPVKKRVRAVRKTPVFSTHPFTPFKPALKGHFSVHIAIWKSTSLNLPHFMSYCTIISSNRDESEGSR